MRRPGWAMAAACGVAGAALVALWADGLAPDVRTVGVIAVPGQAVLPRTEQRDRATHRRAWRMVLRLDPRLRQSRVEWALREGALAGQGYALAWMPESAALHLSRGGEQPLILGIVRLQRAPLEVIVQRQGAALRVSVDGRQVLDVLDPEGSAEPPGSDAYPAAWSVLTAGALGDSTFAVYDDGVLPAAQASDLAPGEAQALAQALALGPADAGERARIGWAEIEPGAPGWRPAVAPGRPDHALLRVRAALWARPERERSDALSAILGQAGQAVAALPSGHPDRGRLALWLAWAEARNALIQAGDGGPDGAAPAVEQLFTAVAHEAAPEGVGMLLALLPRLAERAVRRPPAPRPLAAVLDERAAWLGLLDRSAVAAAERLGPDTDAALRLQLDCISHLAGTLGGTGARTLPLPAGAPEWLAARWRTMAGGDPPPGGLPAPPATTTARSSLAPVIDTLVRGAAIEPLAATRLRAAASDRIVAPDELQRLQDEAGPRWATLDSVLRLLPRLQAAYAAAQTRRAPIEEVEETIQDLRDALKPLKADLLRHGWTKGDADALITYDPLAFAISALAESRIRAAERLRPGAQPLPAIPAPGSQHYERLAPYASLLSGAPNATDLIWLHDDGILPPAHALAAALALREVRLREAGGEVGAAQWELLRRMRSPTLPLELLIPEAPADTGTDVPPPAAGP